MVIQKLSSKYPNTPLHTWRTYDAYASSLRRIFRLQKPYGFGEARSRFPIAVTVWRSAASSFIGQGIRIRPHAVRSRREDTLIEPNTPSRVLIFTIDAEHLSFCTPTTALDHAFR